MNYFDGIKVGDKVWDFQYGWGKVIDILKNNLNFPIVVIFENGEKESFDYNGKPFKNSNQTLFWDEIKFEIPKKPKVELKENYSKLIKPSAKINYTYTSFEQIKRFARLLALRDQECQDSRGYEPKLGKKSYGITKEAISKKFHIYETYDNCPDRVYLKTKEDAQKICDILNSGRFDLEGE